MKKATITNINRLSRVRGDMCISAYMPLHVGPENHLKDEIAIKHLLSTLHNKIEHVTDVRAKHAYNRIKIELERVLVGRKGITVCLFDDLDKLTILYTSAEIEEQVYVNGKFATDILAAVTPKTTPYYVLALSQHAAHLFLADNSSIKIQHRFAATADVEPMLKELHIDELNTSINTHPTGEGGGKGSHGFHGFGSLKDQRKVLIGSYFRKIDAKLLPIFRKKRLPVILAGVGYLLPVYRKVSKYDNIVKSELHGNMDKISDKKLLELVRPLIADSSVVA